MHINFDGFSRIQRLKVYFALYATVQYCMIKLIKNSAKFFTSMNIWFFELSNNKILNSQNSIQNDVTTDTVFSYYLHVPENFDRI